jgi:hypothetical protein
MHRQSESDHVNQPSSLSCHAPTAATIAKCCNGSKVLAFVYVVLAYICIDAPIIIPYIPPLVYYTIQLKKLGKELILPRPFSPETESLCCTCMFFCLCVPHGLFLTCLLIGSFFMFDMLCYD